MPLGIEHFIVLIVDDFRRDNIFIVCGLSSWTRHRRSLDLSCVSLWRNSISFHCSRIFFSFCLVVCSENDSNLYHLWTFMDRLMVVVASFDPLNVAEIMQGYFWQTSLKQQKQNLLKYCDNDFSSSKQPFDVWWREYVIVVAVHRYCDVHACFVEISRWISQRQCIFAQIYHYYSSEVV